MSEAPTRPGRPTASARAVVAALVVDAVLVVAFAAIGRATHHDGVLGEGGSGLATTAWPFLAALAAGWLASLAWRAPLAPLRAGAPIWLVTVVGGMLLRALSGQGTAVPFIVVATLTLLAMLVGWRAIASLAVRARRDPAP
ncbi:DUF3054 domain-containing protein [Agrococcus baldri]|uniref:DUF3054 domain-containing protein n=1 Tax=Agrococcus baldri TaxID=153730 RepID=A0AA87RBZ9_9MICO|nr:DUF3054 domain-containing protein [Agrococcus baldri]GEK80315.1 hypothetical protein ABA31_16660 [Agrococcus baldri]